jgi:uncharacterized protein
MRAPVLLAALALLAAACDSGPAALPAATPFPALTGRVVDGADLLPVEDERLLETASAAIERETGAQFVVATVPSLQGLSIENYGVQLGRTWGVGSRERNDGVILLVAPNEGKVRIEVGTGLENRVTDPFAARVLRERVLPRFQSNSMREGILAGSAAIVARLHSRQSDDEIAVEDRLVRS